MKILFMGTPDFARDSLEMLYNSEHKIIGVVTNPDKPKGRGMKMLYTPVKEFAMEKNLEIYQPERVKNNSEFINVIKGLKPDIICVVAYGKILPKDILEIPKFGCVNLHGSLLPKYRGAAPIQWAVLNGDTKTGVTTIYMNEEMDAGDIILEKEVDIGVDETTGELWEKLSKIGAKLLLDTVNQIEAGIAPRKKQSEQYTLAPMLNKEISKIDWKTMSSMKIKDLVRGLNPIMGAYTMYNDKKIKLWKVRIVSYDEECLQGIDVENKMEGTILVANDKNGLYIKTIDSVIKVLEIQGENGKKLQIQEFLRGNKLEPNAILV